ncbi:unnamed protein product, partial [Mesorhabditis spiculigera]
MFYDLRILNSRDSNLSLIWRLANSRPTRNVQKAAFLAVDVASACKTLLERIPEPKYSRRGTEEKFSLYLLGRLTYGIVLLYQKQLFFLEMDMKETAANLRGLSSIQFQQKKRQTIEKTPIHKKKRKLSDSEGSRANLSLEQLDQQANRAAIERITLNEPEAIFDWRERSCFGERDELPAPTEEYYQMLASGDIMFSAEHSKDKTAVPQLANNNNGEATLGEKTVPARESQLPFEDIKQVTDAEMLAPGAEFLDPLQQDDLMQDLQFNALDLLDTQPPIEQQLQEMDKEMEELDQKAIDSLHLESLNTADVLAEELSAKRKHQKKKPSKLIIDDDIQLSVRAIKRLMDEIAEGPIKVPPKPSHLPRGQLLAEQLFAQRPLTSINYNKDLDICFPTRGDERFIVDEDDVQIDPLEAIDIGKPPATPLPQVEPLPADELQQLNLMDEMQMNPFDQPMFHDMMHELAPPQQQDEEPEEARRRVSSLAHANRVSLFPQGEGSRLEEDDGVKPLLTELISDRDSTHADRLDTRETFLGNAHLLANDDGQVNMSELVPPHYTTAPLAARRFALLLESLKSGEVLSVFQPDAFDEICIQLPPLAAN